MAAVSAAAIWWLLSSVGSLSAGQREESRVRLEDSIRRAAVTCYTAEGVYPPTLDYLRTHYGVQVDETRFAVFYSAFAENLMPEITVVERDETE